jgi:hypothetical protein
MLHHIAILWMVYELSAQRTVNFTPYFGHLVISETTGVFFCTAWLVRATWPSTRGSLGVNVLEHLFALTFFLLRGIHLTLMLVRLFVSSEAKAELGLSVRMTFLAIAVMQWLWLFKIGRGLWQGRRRERSQVATQQAAVKKEQ